MTPGIVAESDLAGNLQSEYVFFGGERVGRRDFPSGSVAYYFSDDLKTAAVITDATGNIKSESDYYPWGGELQFVNSDSNHYKFTGKERDSETGLDYFGARYYSNGLGRFITPDWASVPIPVPYADFGDPQSLNQYSYVRNIPTSKADLDGHFPCPPLCDLPTPTAEDWKLIEEAGKGLLEKGGSALASAVGRISVLSTVVIGAYAASPFIQTVGQSDADERAQIEQAQREQEQQAEPQVSTSGAGRKGNGRGGRQKRLRELAKDDKLGSALRGWLQNEINSKRGPLRVPPGMELAHRRGQEARKGFDYSHSDLQDKILHDTQHEIERKCIGCGGTHEQRHPSQQDNR